MLSNQIAPAKMAIVLGKVKTLASKIHKSSAMNEKAIDLKYKEKKIANPLSVVDADLALLNDNIRKHIRTQHPVLATVAQYCFNISGKRLRPVVTLLIARAVSSHLNNSQGDKNSQADATGLGGEVNWKQHQLAEIIEMIHTASLVHDDVIDEATSRRQQPSTNVAFGNKVSVLVGDFLLARASISLSELKNFEVTELMSRVISDLVEGEFMQMKTTNNVTTNFESYIQKTYYKTASLIANGCRAAAILTVKQSEGQEQLHRELIETATVYGHHLGLAFQLFDDILDFTGTKELGKAVNSDMKVGVVTAPALFALEEHPQLLTLMERGFSEENDVSTAYALVNASEGIKKTTQMAMEHVDNAIRSLEKLSDSPAKQALVDIARLVIDRKS